MDELALNGVRGRQIICANQVPHRFARDAGYGRLFQSVRSPQDSGSVRDAFGLPHASNDLHGRGFGRAFRLVHRYASCILDV